METSQHSTDDPATDEHIEAVKRKLAERFAWIAWRASSDDEPGTERDPHHEEVVASSTPPQPV